MKRTTTKLVALALAIILAVTTFAGCSSYDELGEMYGINDAETNNTEIAEDSDVQAQLDEINQSLANALDSIQKLEDSKAELEIDIETANNAIVSLEETNTELRAVNESLNAENTELKAANTSLEAELEAAKAELESAAKHPMVVKDGVLWVHIDDFLNAPNGVGSVVKAKSGEGYALRTLKGVRVKVYDDEHDEEHLVPNFDLPMLDLYNIVLTSDEGKTAFTARFSRYNWEHDALRTEFKSCKFVELKSMPKNGGSGKRFYNLILNTAVVYEDKAGTYRFAVNAGDYGANPTVDLGCQHGTGCHCGDCEKCPALEAEVIVEIETETETKVEYVDRVEYIDRIQYVEIEKPVVEKIEYCGRCDNLIKDCTCKDSDHNDLEEIPNPNDKEDSDHNDLEDIPNPNDKEDTNDKESTDKNSNHNGLEEVTNPNNDKNQNSNHNSTSSRNTSHNNSDGKSKSSSHSPLD